MVSQLLQGTGYQWRGYQWREPSRRRDLTTLRAGVPSYVLSGKSGQREVRYVSVQVTNIGDVPHPWELPKAYVGDSGARYPRG
jgi:hypothetical protein